MLTIDDLSVSVEYAYIMKLLICIWTLHNMYMYVFPTLVIIGI